MRPVDRLQPQRLQSQCGSRSVALANRHNLPMIAFLNLSAHLRLIECIAALGKFFFAISGLSDRHGVDLTATSVKLL
jgi:hypothetical protein